MVKTSHMENLIAKEAGKWKGEDSYQFSSANSINWGRLLPQIVYYFAAYLNLVNQKAVSNGDKVDFERVGHD